MRLPRFILNPAVGVWIRLWQSERKQTARLRRELAKTEDERDEWRDKLLAKVNITPLFTPKPPPPKPAHPVLVGPAAVAAYLESQRGPVNIPTVEEMAEAARRNGT